MTRRRGVKSLKYREISFTDASRNCPYFSSAIGSTINLLATAKGLYVPTFDGPNGVDNSEEVRVNLNTQGTQG